MEKTISRNKTRMPTVTLSVPNSDDHNIHRSKRKPITKTETTKKHDTILSSENAKTLEFFLQEIEKESAKYGLKLNRTKCEHISVNNKNKDKIKFTDGTEVKRMGEVKYLGCMINDNGDPRREVRKRIAECMCTFIKLDTFWKHTNNPIKLKIIVFNAIVRTKLMYGLESVQINDSLKKHMDTFQLNAYRSILGLKHTYIDRLNTNEHIMNTAETEINKHNNSGTHKTITKLSEYYEQQRLKTTAQIIHHKNSEDERVNITFNKENLEINEYEKKRVGRPKHAWWTFSLQSIWTQAQEHDEALKYSIMDTSKEEHRRAIQKEAKNITEKEEKKKK